MPKRTYTCSCLIKLKIRRKPYFFIWCTIIENILLFYLTRREIQLHLFFARTRVGSSESQCNVANNVKTVTLSPTAPVLCSRLKAEYSVRPLINIHEYTCKKKKKTIENS